MADYIKIQQRFSIIEDQLRLIDAEARGEIDKLKKEIATLKGRITVLSGKQLPASAEPAYGGDDE